LKVPTFDGHLNQSMDFPWFREQSGTMIGPSAQPSQTDTDS